MSSDIVFHVGLGQTDAAIFAGGTRARSGDAAQGQFHQWVLGFTLAGGCQYTLGKEMLELRAGDLLLIRSGVSTTWRVPLDRPAASGGENFWEVVYAVFEPRPHWRDWLTYEERFPGVVHLHLDPGKTFECIRRGLKRARATYETGSPARDALTLLAVERVIIDLRLHFQLNQTQLDERVLHAINFMQSRYREPITLRDVARAAPLSVSQLSALFARQMGVSPMQYLESVRLGRASDLLRFTGLSVTEVSRQCGFADPDYFSRRFRQRTGRMPRACRQPDPTNI